MAMILRAFIMLILFWPLTVWAEDYQNIQQVDKKIVLAIDVSGSITPKMYNWQIQGYANALRSPQIAKSISNGHFGRVAFAVIQFSTNTFLMVDWKIVDQHNITELADSIESMSRQEKRQTGIGRALQFSKNLIRNSDIESLQTIIIMNGQDDQNVGIHPWPLSQQISEYLKVTIVGVVIPFRLRTKDPELFYRSYITFGPGNFVLIANDSADFEKGLTKVFKLNKD